MARVMFCSGSGVMLIWTSPTVNFSLAIHALLTMRTREAMPLAPKPNLVLLEDQDCGRDGRRPQTTLVPYRRLGDVGGADDLVREFVNFFLLVPRLVRIELYAQRGRQHFSGELFGVVACLLFRLAEAVVLAEVSVGRLV